MLLSRVANSLYWMGRYLERAENANRHLNVASEFAVELEGINEKIAVAEWTSLVSSVPANSAPKTSSSNTPDSALKYMTSFLIDKSNPYSVITSLDKARENARSVGEITTLEITSNLNQAYRTLNSIKPKDISDYGVAQDIATSTHNSILTTLGAIEHTLTRDEGWNYLKIGEALERTHRTMFVLKTRLPNLQKWATNTDTPLYYASWRSLLQSLASMENYRQENGPRFVPDQVVKFLLFHPSTPRSVNCGARRMRGYLNGMSNSGPGIRESKRRVGKLAAQLEFDQEDIMQPQNLLPFLDDSLDSLFQIHESISNPMRGR